MDPSTTIKYESVFYSNDDWVEIYGYVVVEDPPQMPDPLVFQQATEYC